MTEKIDTQGMSGPSQKGCKDNVFPKDADGNPIYPPFNPTPLPIFDTKERAELKEIMLEALREWVKETEYLTMNTQLLKREKELLEGADIGAHEGMIYGRMYSDWKVRKGYD